MGKRKKNLIIKESPPSTPLPVREIANKQFAQACGVDLSTHDVSENKDGNTDHSKEWEKAKFPSKLALQSNKAYVDLRSDVYDLKTCLKDEEACLDVSRDQRIGLCFCGGGIRSACFYAGVLEALSAKNMFHSIDYISSVSGGAYTSAAFITHLLAAAGNSKLAVKTLVQQMRENVNYFAGDMAASLHVLTAILTGSIHNIYLGLAIAVIIASVVFGNRPEKDFVVAYLWKALYFDLLEDNIEKGVYTASIFFSTRAWFVIGCIIISIWFFSSVMVVLWNFILYQNSVAVIAEKQKPESKKEEEQNKNAQKISRITNENANSVVMFLILSLSCSFVVIELFKFLVFAYGSYLLQASHSHIFVTSAFSYFLMNILVTLSAYAGYLQSIVPAKIAIFTLGLSAPLMFVFATVRFSLWFIFPGKLSVGLEPTVQLSEFGFGNRQIDSSIIAEAIAWIYLAIEILFSDYFNTALHVLYQTRLMKSFYHNGQDVKLSDIPPRPINIFTATLNNFRSYHFDTSSGQRDYQPFVFTQRSIGCDETQYRCTSDLNINLSKAMTISGAALSINIGTYSEQFGSFITRFIFVLLSLNLGIYYYFRSWTFNSFRDLMKRVTIILVALCALMFGPGIGLYKCWAQIHNDTELVKWCSRMTQWFIITVLGLAFINAVGLLLLDAIKVQYFEDTDDEEEEKIEETSDNKQITTDKSLKTTTNETLREAFRTFRKYRLQTKRRLRSFWMSWPINPLAEFPFVRAVYQLIGLNERESSPYLFVSDGGQFDLIGLYEMFKREVPYIIAFDTSVDPKYTFEELYKTLLLAKTDGWIHHVDLDCMDTFQPLPNNPRLTKGNFMKFTVEYRSRDKKTGLRNKGQVWFGKSTVVGKESGLLSLHFLNDHTFPHITTINQFFDDKLFEAYRRIGKHIAFDVLEDFQKNVPPTH